MSGYTADVQSILRCGQCNKPFDKHIYTTVGLEELAVPPGLGLVFHAQEGRRVVTIADPNAQGAGTQRRDGASIESGGMTTTPSSVADSPSIDSGQEANNGGNMLLNGALDMPIPDFSNLGGDYMEWDDANMAFVDFLNTQTTQTNKSYLSPSSSSFSPRSTPLTNQTTREQRDAFSPELSIPTAPTSAVRSLVQRPKIQAGAQRISNLILHTLKSYPLMMLRHNTLPPFIHPSLVSSDVENPDMEPLTNCMSLTHMITSGVQGSRRLFWKNVRLECERLSHEHRKLNKWELLAAMQALSIYILIRLDEGEKDYNNFDFLLVKTVIAIAQQLGEIDITCHTQCGLCNNELELSWKEWIFRESRRRLAVVYRVVNMLIYFEPAAMCDMPTEFILAPLPAKKQLWEAGDEFSWMTECKREPGIQVSFGLAADGEIVKLDEGRLSCSDAWLSYQSVDAAKTPPRSTASWEEWCSGIDGFGGLVMLAASLIP
ncbi:hypothetical protein HD806DRAFT_518473 [Xylariaceae sp. AK1471]|nr:hypothetical protein HD806DRAFT_518473 [Xylariaceae sp. AK1471]